MFALPALAAVLFLAVTTLAASFLTVASSVALFLVAALLAALGNGSISSFHLPLEILQVDWVHSEVIHSSKMYCHQRHCHQDKAGLVCRKEHHSKKVTLLKQSYSWI
jgi:hypothetical protein